MPDQYILNKNIAKKISHLLKWILCQVLFIMYFVMACCDIQPDLMNNVSNTHLHVSPMAVNENTYNN